MKSDSYILIQGWMINELQLKSNSLLIFAIIYGYSKDNQGKFDGSLNYLCKSIGSSKNTVMNCLNELLQKELILKETIVINNITFCKYFQNDMVVQKLVWGGAKNDMGGGAKIEPNNTNYNNTKENNNNDIDFDSLIKYYNQKFKKSVRVFPIKAKKQFNYLIKNNYTKADIKKVMDIAFLDEFHKKDNYKYVTLEFLSRLDKFERYVAMELPKEKPVKDGHINH